MIFDFIITLKRRSYKWVDMISQFMLFIAVVSFGMFGFETEGQKKYALFAICLLVIAFWIASIIKKRNTGAAYFRLPLSLSVIGWLIIPDQQIALAVLYGVAGLFERQVKFPEEIGFSNEHIVFNSFPKKTYNWNEILNVVLKDNIITVDFKNNKLIQKEVDEHVPPTIEVEFNEFCKQQLSRESIVGISTSNGQ